MELRKHVYLICQTTDHKAIVFSLKIFDKTF